MTSDHGEDDELERMLEEADRLAAKMRAAAMASNSHFKAQPPNTANADSQASSRIVPETVDSEENGDENPNSLPPHMPPPPPKHPPRQPSASTIDTGVPISTVQVPHHPPSFDDDALSLPSNIHIVNPFDSADPKSSQEVEAALRATQNMEKALQALGVKEDGTSSPLPPDAVAASLGSPRSPSLLVNKTNDAQIPSDTRSNPSKPPPPPPSSLLPQEGDADYVPLKDYSFKPSKFTPDTDVTWEQVDTAKEQDDDFVPLRDYSSQGTKNQPNKAASLFTNGADVYTGKSRGKSKRRRRRRTIAGAILALGLLLFLVYLSMRETTTSTADTPPDKEEVTSKQDRPSPSYSTRESPNEPIQVTPLAWATSQDSSQGLKDADGDIDLDWGSEDSEGSSGSTAESFELEEYDDALVLVEIKPARDVKCSMPMAWLVTPDCHDSAETGERLEAVLHTMLI